MTPEEAAYWEMMRVRHVLTQQMIEAEVALATHLIETLPADEAKVLGILTVQVENLYAVERLVDLTEPLGWQEFINEGKEEVKRNVE